jgi:hypothetical protein
MSDPRLSDDCACGQTANGYVPCPANMTYAPTWVPSWIIAEAISGKKSVWDARTTKCLAEALDYYHAMRPEVRIWANLPDEYVRLAKEWDDPVKRGELLKKMAVSKDITEFFSPHLSAHENIRLWLGRFKDYLDVIELIALHNVIPEKSKGAADIFYDRF